ncbi:hypothetical protein [Streptomyces sp. NPDC005548]|uniref:hypothetical protein n=1 Tax=Streptomyces sp. NPDC005548 TaxID=3364724 RepID=UPI00367439A5
MRTADPSPPTWSRDKGYGISAEVIGRWLAQDAGRREQIVLATKVYQPMDTGPDDRMPRQLTGTTAANWRTPADVDPAVGLARAAA